MQLEFLQEKNADHVESYTRNLIASTLSISIANHENVRIVAKRITINLIRVKDRIAKCVRNVIRKSKTQTKDTLHACDIACDSQME